MKKLMSVLFILLLTFGLCTSLTACKDDEDPIDKPVTVDNVFVDDSYAPSRFSGSLVKVDNKNGLKITFDSSQPHADDIRWGIASTGIIVNTKKFPYMVAKISRIDCLAQIKMVVGSSEYALLSADTPDSKVYVVDMSKVGENNQCISEKLSAQLRFATVSDNARVDASIVVDYVTFMEQPPLNETFSSVNDWTVTNAKSDYSDGYLKLKSNGGTASISKETYCAFEILNTFEAAIQSFNGKWSFKAVKDGNSVTLIDSTSDKGGFVIDAVAKGLKLNGKYKLVFEFDDEFSITSLTLNNSKAFNISEFNKDKIALIDDNGKVRVDEVDGKAKLAIPQNAFVTLTGFYNVDAMPTLKVEIDDVSSGASYEIRIYSSNTEYIATSKTSVAKINTINLNQLGLRGEIGFDVRIYIFGDLGSSIELKSVVALTDGVRVMQNRIYEDFTQNGSAMGWKNSGEGVATYLDNKLTITNKKDIGDSYSVATKFYLVDLEQYPVFNFSVVESTGTWKIELFDEKDAAFMSWNESGAKEVSFDLSSATAMKDKKQARIKINIYLAGDMNQYCKLSVFESVSKINN